MTDTPNFYFFNKKKSSVTAFILDLSINGIFEAWKILVAEKEIILAQEYRLFLIRLPIYMGKMALTQKSEPIHPSSILDLPVYLALLVVYRGFTFEII